MLKAIGIMERQYAGKLLHFFFNGFGYQLQLAEADRKMQELTLPELEPNKRIKANPRTGAPARLVVDPRQRRTQKNTRRIKKALDAIDQHLCPQLGAFPVIDQSKIKYICLVDSDEEPNIAIHP